MTVAAPMRDVGEVVARDGTRLLVRRWRAADGSGWASVLLVHGLAEHSGRYDHVGTQLAEAGLDVHAFDLRGFGGSGGPRAHVDRWSELHDDLEERIAGVRSVDPARPLVLYAHSLGALIALGYVLDGRGLPDLLVLSAPAINARIPLWQRGLVGSLRRVAPGLMVSNRLKRDDLSTDPEVATRYFADPLNQHSSSVAFAHAAFSEQRRVRRSLDRLAIPTLVIHGGDDRLVPTAGSEILEGVPGVTRRVYPGLRHEVHNERVAAQVVDDVVAWIRDQARDLEGRRDVPG